MENNQAIAQAAAMLSLKDIKAALPDAQIHCSGDVDSLSFESGSISTDSRTITEGQWYLALQGERFDGHRFLEAAIARGARGCIISDMLTLSGSRLEGSKKVVFVEVANTLAAYQVLANHYLKLIKPFVLAITGSSGKTTTKEIAAAVFAESFRIHKSPANENNEIGLPKTILNMPSDTQLLIAEMAMRGLGQIDELARIAPPDVAIITNAGTAHIELLGSQEKIAIAKCELLAHLDTANGLALIGNPAVHLVQQAKTVYTGQIDLCTDDQIKEVAVDFSATTFSVKGMKTNFVIHTHGIAHLQDAWCVIKAASKAGMDESAIARGLANYRSIDGRGNCIKTKSGATVIDESYNANPDSMRCAISTMLDTRVFPHVNKIVVLGDMGELGAQSDILHFQLGEWLKDKAISQLITVGNLSKRIAEGASGASYPVKHLGTNAEVSSLIRPELNKETCVIVKGSHSAQLETVVADLVSTSHK